MAARLIDADASSTELLAPFDEQTGFDVAAGRRRLYELRDAASGDVVGSAVLGAESLDLDVTPEFRGRGFGRSAAEQLLARAGDGPLTAWSHENHPAARALANRFGFAATRTLLHLRLDELRGVDLAAAAGPATIGAFRPGTDDAEWLALNARVFAAHPEQGGVKQSDLDDRMRAPWFRADDFLVARDDTGRMVGYNWLKADGSAARIDSPAGATPPGGGAARIDETAEIYVIGVAPEASARGLGRALMTAGLAHLRERGFRSAELYVEGDNSPAVHLYRSLGFVDESVHVQYSRSFTPR
ncbi:mycothiol synthase [Gryllotalpicola reticulitermitis]|uniref:Mycothiol synthase n=1 Tax=Gryllotalpicola reticulitermitis TaxID=1184153 RepID=A0ABV8Q1P6_9MICO